MKGFPSPLRMETDPPEKGVKTDPPEKGAKTNSSENGFNRRGRTKKWADTHEGKPSGGFQDKYMGVGYHYGIGEDEDVLIEGRYSEHEETADGIGFQILERPSMGGKTYSITYDKGARARMRQNQIDENPSNVDLRNNREMEKEGYSAERLLEHERAMAAQNAMLKIGGGVEFNVYQNEYKSDKELLKAFNSLPDSYDVIKQEAMMEATKNFQEEFARRRAAEL